MRYKYRIYHNRNARTGIEPELDEKKQLFEYGHLGGHLGRFFKERPIDVRCTPLVPAIRGILAELITGLPEIDVIRFLEQALDVLNANPPQFGLHLQLERIVD